MSEIGASNLANRIMGQITAIARRVAHLETLEGGGGGGVERREIVFSIEGNLTTGEKPLRIYPPTGDWTIEKVRAAVNTAPLNQAIVCDVQLNGVTIFTNQGKRPSIGAGAYLDDSDVPDVTAMDGDDYLQYGVDQIGTGTVGADLTVHVIFIAA